MHDIGGRPVGTEHLSGGAAHWNPLGATAESKSGTQKKHLPHIGARRPHRVPQASRDNTGIIPDTFMDSGTPMAPLRTNHAASRAPRAHSTQPVDGQQGARTRPENVPKPAPK